MSSALKNLTNIFKISGGTTSNYAKILEGLKAIIQIIGRVILSLYSIIAKYLFPILIKLTGILGGVLGKNRWNVSKCFSLYFRCHSKI